MSIGNIITVATQEIIYCRRQIMHDTHDMIRYTHQHARSKQNREGQEMANLPLDFLIPVVVALPLLAFWAWMFDAMLKNESLPGFLAGDPFTGDVKSDWTL